MRLTVLIVALTVLIGRLAAASDDVAGGSQKIGPSFDCGKAVKPIAKMICASDALSRLDMEFVQAYQALRHQVGEPRQRQLREEALEFHHRMLRECGVPDDGPTSGSVSCVRDAYAKQRLQWLSQLVGPASEEAKRDIEKHLLLHHDLRRLGFMKANADGVYGPDTRLGLTEFQRAYGLPVTGFLSDADSQVIENRIRVTSNAPEQALVRPGAQNDILPLPNPASGTQSSQVVPQPQRERELPKLPSAQAITGREPAREFGRTAQAVTPPTIPPGPAASSSDQAAEAVRKLGLLGTFSANCAAFSASQSWGSVWEIDAKGNVTITIEASDGAAKFVMTNAEILANDQLRFRRQRVEGPDRNEITVERIGDGYRVLRNVNLINGVVLVENGLTTRDRKPADVMKLCETPLSRPSEGRQGAQTQVLTRGLSDSECKSLLDYSTEFLGSEFEFDARCHALYNINPSRGSNGLACCLRALRSHVWGFFFVGLYPQSVTKVTAFSYITISYEFTSAKYLKMASLSSSTAWSPELGVGY